MHDTTPKPAGPDRQEGQRQGDRSGGARQSDSQPPHRVHPRRISEEEAQRIPADPDPDDPVSP